MIRFITVRAGAMVRVSANSTHLHVGVCDNEQEGSGDGKSSIQYGRARDY